MGGVEQSLDAAATILTALLLAFAALSLRGLIALVFHRLALIALAAALAWRRVAAGKG
jgi:hypothetical protein